MQNSSCHENFVHEETNVDNEAVVSEGLNEGRSRNKRKANQGTSQAPAEKKTRSFVWNHFKRLEQNRNRCKCNYCGNEFTCASTGGTSNLKNHLERCKEFEAWAKRNTQQNINSGTGANSGSVQLGKVSEAVFREASNEMLVLGQLPISFIESLAWRHFCRRVQLYRPHCRKTASKDIVQMYVKQKAALKALFLSSKQRVSLTTDIWVAPTTAASYMVITCHFVDSCWKLRKLIIGFKHVLDHKSSTIASVLLDCLADWGIEKIFTITVDNASANTSALKKFSEKFQELASDALLLGGECLHVRCAAHILNLIVKDGMSSLSESVTSVRNAVVYVRGSGARLESFGQKLDSVKVSRGSLILDVKTRWNSTFLMLTRALKFRVGFDRMQIEDKLYNDHFLAFENGVSRVGPPVSSDWNKVDGLVQILTAFYKSTLVVSASTKVCSHKIYNEVCDIDRHLNALSVGADLDLCLRAETMRDKFDKYWDGLENINRLLIIASVFDPRNKMKFASLCFDMLYGKGSARSKELNDSVYSVMGRLFEEYSRNVRSAGFPATTSQVGTDFQSGGVGQSTIIDDDDYVDVEMLVGVEPMASVYKKVVNAEGFAANTSELDMYLRENVETPRENLLGSEFDILSWWRVNSPKYPVLSELAKDILAMQVSSVASESAFSTSGRILDPQRSCLTHYMIEVLMSVEQWMKSDHNFGEKGVENFAQMVADVEEQDKLEKEFQNQS